MKCVGRHAKGSRAMLVPDERVDPDNWAGRVPQTLALTHPNLVDSPLDEPLCLIADFHLRRPKTTKFPEAPIGQGTGDADKFTRMIGDAMQNAGVIADDSRITEIHARKMYASPGTGEGALLELRPAQPLIGNGRMPVRISTGRVNSLVGHVDDPASLPALLRKVADQIEGVGK
jgi:hypothetical protein